jgi:hypothetical protein
MTPPLDSILRQTNPVHILTSYFHMIHFDTDAPPTLESES